MESGELQLRHLYFSTVKVSVDLQMRSVRNIETLIGLAVGAILLSLTGLAIVLSLLPPALLPVQRVPILSSHLCHRLLARRMGRRPVEGRNS